MRANKKIASFAVFAYGAKHTICQQVMGLYLSRYNEAMLDSAVVIVIYTVSYTGICEYNVVNKGIIVVVRGGKNR